jgi:hypothetical protein
MKYNTKLTRTQREYIYSRFGISRDQLYRILKGKTIKHNEFKLLKTKIDNYVATNKIKNSKYDTASYIEFLEKSIVDVSLNAKITPEISTLLNELIENE